MPTTSYIAVPSPVEFNLTEAALAAMNPPRLPLVPGTDWSLRVRLFDAATVDPKTKPYGDAWDLTGLLEAVFTLRPRPEQAAPIFSRTLNGAIAGDARLQITLDAQGAITPVDILQVPVSGKGWLEILFSRQTADRDALLLLVGTNYYDLQVQFADGRRIAALFGAITVKRPRRA